MDRRFSRRFLLRSAAAAATLPLPLGTAACTSRDTAEPRAGALFEDDERRAVAAFSNIVLPVERGTRGGADLGAAAFIEQLLTAFDFDPPRIYADGPYSGRQPFPDGNGGAESGLPPNDFLRFVPLDRVAEKAWRARLFGSRAVLGEAFNQGLVPETVGLRSLFKDGMRQAIDHAGVPIESLSPDALLDAFVSLDKSLQDAFIDLVPQAAMGAPEYGGNPGGAGWSMVRYEGDSMPLGYSLFDAQTGLYEERPDSPMSKPGPSQDPAPMDDGTRDLLKTVVGFTGGKVFG